MSCTTICVGDLPNTARHHRDRVQYIRVYARDITTRQDSSSSAPNCFARHFVASQETQTESKTNTQKNATLSTHTTTYARYNVHVHAVSYWVKLSGRTVKPCTHAPDAWTQHAYYKTVMRLCRNLGVRVRVCKLPSWTGVHCKCFINRVRPFMSTCSIATCVLLFLRVHTIHKPDPIKRQHIPGLCPINNNPYISEYACERQDRSLTLSSDNKKSGCVEYTRVRFERCTRT